ncbi:MAG: LuxR C-terminal-related transcriptional regulator [Actinomycetota bacterium]
MNGQAAFQLPVGTVTFLLADLEGSTRLWEQHGEAMKRVIARMYEIVDQNVALADGVRPVEQGEGDSVVAAFTRASDALACATAIQLALQEEDWPEALEIKLRIGIHTGEAQLRDEGNYFGQAIIRCARLRATGHGGQILLSQVTSDLVIDSLPSGISLQNLGLKRLRDLSRPERVFQACHAKLLSEFPPIKSLDELSNNLPVQLDSFVGREAEIADITQLLESTRLFTITGSGGCGKTRLALQVAAETIDAYPDGVWWVDLAPLADPTLVHNAVAATLSVREVPMQELSDTIENHLREKRALLVLDNCEHLISSCHALAETMLKSCPGVDLLATSREPLGLAGETTWRVPSLSLPSETQAANIEVLTQCEAVRLFIDRAVKARPNFEVTNENAPFVAEICHRLDGIPLAIELAAARTRVLTTEQIAEGLVDRFLLLTGGARTALPRQRTLEASVEWSHNLLDNDERTLLRRLSVFAGGFTLSAAETVCQAEGIEKFRILDLLTQLVDRSLVQMEEVTGAARYRLLETIRHFARQQLTDSNESASVRSNHLQFYLSLVERAEPELEGAGLREWVKRLDSENDNLRTAAEWGLASKQVDAVLRMCSSQFLFWLVRGHLSEGVRLATAALASADGQPLSRAKALVSASGAAIWLLDTHAARSFGDEALALGRSLDDQRIVARALCWLGWERIVSDPIAATPIFEEAISLSDMTGDQWYLAQSHIGSGFIKMLGGQFAEARTQLESANTIARRTGDYLNTRESLTWLGYTAAFLGRFDEAITFTGEALSLMEEMQDDFFKATALSVVGWIQTQRGEYEQARSSFHESIELSRQTSNDLMRATAQSWLGTFEYQMGNIELAQAVSEESLVLLSAMDFKWAIADTLLAMHGQAVARGDMVSAKSHLQESKQVARESNLPYSLSRALLAEAQLARLADDLESAETLQQEALSLLMESDETPGIILALEGLAGVATRQDSSHEAARLMGSADAFRTAIGFVRYPIERDRYDADIKRARTAIGDDEFEATFNEGAALTVEGAISYARRARGERKRPSSGWASLTPTELDVIRLVAKGLTSPQIGKRMFITAGTVKVHLSHVFAKLGVSSRSELAAEAVRREP